VPTLDREKVEAKWNDNKHGLITTAQTTNHGIKAEALHQIWVKYWADRIAIADATLNAIFATEQRDHVDLSDTDTYRKAKQVNDLGLYLLADSVGALEICRAADAAGKSLTLDELNQRVIDHSKAMEVMQVLAAAAASMPRTGGRGGAAGGVKPEPVFKAATVK